MDSILGHLRDPAHTQHTVHGRQRLEQDVCGTIGVGGSGSYYGLKLYMQLNNN